MIVAFALIIFAIGVILIQIEYMHHLHLQYTIKRSMKQALIASMKTQNEAENLKVFTQMFTQNIPKRSYEIILLEYQEYPKVVSYRVIVDEYYWFEETLIEEGMDEI